MRMRKRTVDSERLNDTKTIPIQNFKINETWRSSLVKAFNSSNQHEICFHFEAMVREKLLKIMSVKSSYFYYNDWVILHNFPIIRPNIRITELSGQGGILRSRPLLLVSKFDRMMISRYFDGAGWKRKRRQSIFVSESWFFTFGKNWERFRLERKKKKKERRITALWQVINALSIFRLVFRDYCLELAYILRISGMPNSLWQSFFENTEQYNVIIW